MHGHNYDRKWWPLFTIWHFWSQSIISGYAVTSGSYFSTEHDDYATGAPRANGLRGKVIILDHTTIKEQFSIDPVVDISGEQIGEYFGAALASCDINGDDKDELLVGAPYWTLISDEGRIYIYTGSDNVSTAFNLHLPA